MNKLILILLLISSNFSFSQGIEGEMQATKENKVLIIELMEVTKFEAYFKDYCSRRIDFLGEEKGLTKEKIAECKKKINFKEFLDYTVFNQFANYSSDELKEMIVLCEKLNAKKNKYSSIFFSTPGLESNLELMIRQYMKTEKL